MQGSSCDVPLQKESYTIQHQVKLFIQIISDRIKEMLHFNNIFKVHKNNKSSLITKN